MLSKQHMNASPLEQAPSPYGSKSKARPSKAGMVGEAPAHLPWLPVQVQREVSPWLSPHEHFAPLCQNERVHAPTSHLLHLQPWEHITSISYAAMARPTTQATARKHQNTWMVTFKLSVIELLAYQVLQKSQI